MEFVFTPSECKGDDRKFEGTITLKVLSTPEKFRLMSKCEFEIGDDGISKKSMKQLNAIADLIDATKPYYLKVNIKKVDGSKEYNSFEDMEYCEDCSTILIETSSKFLNGFKVGNGSLPT